QHRLEQFAHFGWIAGSTDTASFHNFELGVGSVGAARNQCTGVAHPLSGRSRYTGDEADNRLLHVVLRPFGSVDFVRAADFTDHDHSVGVGIIIEHLQHVDVLQAVDGIAADADSRGLAETEFGKLSHGFVSKRARTANDADATLARNVTRHDADLDFVGGDQAGAVGAQQQGLFVFSAHAVANLQHVANGDAFSNADDEVQIGIDRFPDRIGSARGRHVNHGDGGTGFSLRFLDRSVDGHTFEILAGLLGMHAGNEVFLSV